MSLDDEFAALFGEYATPAAPEPNASAAPEQAAPRLFPDTFVYASRMIKRLSRSEERVFASAPTISLEDRTIRMSIPDDMRARDGFGYATEGAVDGRYMPEEAVGSGDRIELTDQAQVINHAINQAKMQDRSWPTVQYLWDAHPILEWFADRANTFFPDHSAPVAPLGGMAKGEVAVVMHGAIPNANGAPVVDRWAVVIQEPGGSARIEEVPDFIARVRLAQDTPGRAVEELGPAQAAIPAAVDRFQTHLVELRRERAAQIQRELDAVFDRLGELEGRFRAQLTLKLGEVPVTDSGLSPTEKRRKTIRRAKEERIERLFEDWAEWFERTRQMVDDPNPYVDVKAVFVG